ncbi:MAG: peptidase domain-containing ABC transporter [Rhizobacter sp.]
MSTEPGGRKASSGQRATESLRFGFQREVPLVLQSEAAECGLASLAMVAGYHGYVTDMASLRSRFSVSLKGVTARTVVEMGEALHLAGRALRLDLEELPQLKLPCILHWEMSHFVVLTKVLAGGTGIVIHDPARGERRVPMEEVSRSFSGVALEFTPVEGFEVKQETKPLRLSQIMGRVTGLRRSLGQILLLAMSLEVFALAAPLFMQWVVDNAIVSADRGLLSLLALGFGLLVVVQTVLSLVRTWVVLYMASHLNLQWSANVFTHLLRLPVSYFEKRHLGDVVSRFNSIHSIQQTLTTNFVEAIVDGLMALAMLAVMLYYSVWLSLVVVASLGIYAALRWMFYGPLKRATQEHLVMSAKEQTLFIESIQSVQSIKLFNHEYDRRARWLNAVVDAMNRLLTTQKLSVSLNSAHGLLSGIENVVVVWIAAGLVMDRSFSVGMLFAFVSYKSTFSQRLHSLIDKFVDLQMMRVQGDRLADIVLAEPEADESSKTREKLPAHASLEVRDLWFRYSDSEPWVLQGVNIVFRAGECTALTGVSGCGKTTLVKLMLGLLKPTQGQILLGGVPIERLGNRAYRKLIGAVMQDDQLLSGSLTDNIAFFDQKLDMDRVVSCAELAAVHKEIEQMPMGYNTLIGDMGTSLSGGQKQRVMLARALYKKPKVLFLDEATSHLDTARESFINEAVKKLPITRIIVAHRPETIRSAQRVVVLESGVVAKDFSDVSENRGAAFAPGRARS